VPALQGLEQRIGRRREGDWQIRLVRQSEDRRSHVARVEQNVLLTRLRIVAQGKDHGCMSWGARQQ